MEVWSTRTDGWNFLVTGAEPTREPVWLAGSFSTHPNESSSACTAIIHGTEEGKIKYQQQLSSSPVFPSLNQWRWLRRDEKTHMAVLGKETSAGMPVVTRRVASHGDTAASILKFVFLPLPVLMNRDLNFFLLVSIIETLLFIVTMLFTVCYKCLWWETELFLWLWLHKVVIPVWWSARIREWRGAQVRVLEKLQTRDMLMY